MTRTITFSKPSTSLDQDDDKMILDIPSVMENNGIVTPGEVISDDSIWMRGHGVYGKNNVTYSSLAGTVTKTNKLLSVIPYNAKYVPVIGDYVIGRITEVANKRWKVDIGAPQDATLMLGSVNLPGGVLRRKTESDELRMRQFLNEGDLLNAEVQGLFTGGAASLHTRSLRYGKLRNGMFVKVKSSLVMRLKQHVHHLPNNVDLTIGVNGYIWLSKTIAKAPKSNVSITRLEEESSMEIYSDKNEEISPLVREAIARYADCIRIMEIKGIQINEVRLIDAYEASLSFELSSLLEPEVIEKICEGIFSMSARG